MSKIFTLLSFVFISFSLTAQTNIELLSQVDYPGDEGNDVWGYVAPNGDEYAIFGTVNGVSVVNITDPANPQVVDFIDQQSSTWRDIKTWGDFAYVTSDQGGTTDGLLIIDMSTLPDSITYRNINPEIENNGIINTCHNIYIDEFGYAYLSGCSNIINGGLIVFDVATTPGEPILAGLGFPEYSHDVYVRDNLAYSSEINVGQFAIYDVSNKDSIELLATQNTPFNFTHNAWLSDDSNTLFTTDERPNAPVAAYDISDFSNIQFLDEYRPSLTLGTGVIPHNVHVLNDYLVISYYSDGCKIVDASKPDNLVEIGDYDTFLLGAQGFNGAWGAYPYFPSGTVIIGDIGSPDENGNNVAKLFMLAPNYVRASYLEGQITDAETGMGIIDARLSIDATDVIEFTNGMGDYKTGYHEEGEFTVNVTASGFLPGTATVTLTRGEVEVLNLELEPRPRVNITGNVTDASSGNPIEGALVKLVAEEFIEEAATDANGNFQLPGVFSSDYEVIVGAWGYKYSTGSNVSLDGSTTEEQLNYTLEPGIEDIFSLDLGWETQFSGFQGAWVREAPIGQAAPGSSLFIAPGMDSEDAGNECYVTGNSVDFFDGFMLGTATLTSPVFDVTNMINPALSYETWFWVSSFEGGPDQERFEISLTNGSETVRIDSLLFNDAILDGDTLNEWMFSGEVLINDFLTPSDQMQVIIEINESGFNTAVEGGFDNFKVYDAEVSSVEYVDLSAEFKISPNPSTDVIQLTLPAEMNNGESILNVFDVNGRRVLTDRVTNVKHSLNVNQLNPGVYWLELMGSNDTRAMQKLIKI